MSGIVQKARDLMFVLLCIGLAVYFEIIADGNLLKGSDWFLIPLLVAVEMVGTFLGSVKVIRSVLRS